MPKGSHCNTVIATARACMLQPPLGGQAAIPSLQPDHSVTVALLLLCTANARLHPLIGTCQRRCKHSQTAVLTIRWSSSSKIRRRPPQLNKPLLSAGRFFLFFFLQGCHQSKLCYRRHRGARLQAGIVVWLQHLAQKIWRKVPAQATVSDGEVSIASRTHLHMIWNPS